MTRPLPCPFCGGDVDQVVEIKRQNHGGFKHLSQLVHNCSVGFFSNFGAGMQFFCQDNEDHRKLSRMADEQLSRWNTRDGVP